MQTNLDFLETGQPWPPDSEAERFRTYEINKQLFNGEHGEVFKEQWRRVERVIGEYQDVISYGAVVNYFQLISKKTADMLFSEQPTIRAGDDTDAETIRQILANQPLVTHCFECAIDASRFGDGLLNVFKDTGSGKVRIGAGRTDCWIKVVSLENFKETVIDVLGIKQKSTPDATDYDRLFVAIYYADGQLETRTLELKGNTLGAMLTQGKKAPTGATESTLISVGNVTTSDQIYGLDDYGVVEDIVVEIEIRAAQISKILDKHAAPSMQGPESALEDDGNGGRHLRSGEYYVNQSEDPRVPPGNISYLTWDGNLEAAFKALDWWVNQLRIISEMGALLSDMSDRSGAIPSGSAMRRMMNQVLAKVARIRVNFDFALKKAFRVAAEMMGKPLKADVDITWFDGLPDDPMETAQIAQTRTGAKQTKSIKTSIMDADGLDEEGAEKEYARILEESEDAENQALIRQYAAEIGQRSEPPSDVEAPQ